MWKYVLVQNIVQMLNFWILLIHLKSILLILSPFFTLQKHFFSKWKLNWLEVFLWDFFLKTSEVLALFFRIIILYLQSTLNSKYCIKLKYFLVNSGGLCKRMPKMVPFAAPTNTQSPIHLQYFEREYLSSCTTFRLCWVKLKEKSFLNICQWNVRPWCIWRCSTSRFIVNLKRETNNNVLS